MKYYIAGLVSVLFIGTLSIKTPVVEVTIYKPISVKYERLAIKAYQSKKPAKAKYVKPVVKKPPERTESVGNVQALIIKWAKHYGVSSELLLKVARCESQFNPSAQNKGYYAGGGHPTGVFQFLPETFNRYSSRAGVSGDIWNANDNVRVAAYAFSVGGAGEWACK